VLHERLTAWLRLPQRRLALLAASFDEVPRRHPRFVAWRARWAHAVEGFAPPESDAADLPCVLVDDTAVGVQLIDRVHWRGRAERDPRSARLLRDSIDAVLQRSEASFSVNRVGL
jgi:hypothetical protein